MDYIQIFVSAAPDLFNNFKLRLAENGCYILKDVITQKEGEIVANYGVIKTRGTGDDVHSFLAGGDETVGTISKDSNVFIIDLREDILLSIRKDRKTRNITTSGNVKEYGAKERHPTV